MAASPSYAGEVYKGPVPAEIIKIIDGDTVDVRVQTWIGQYMRVSVRIYGIDTPEFRASCPEEKRLAHKARQALAGLVSQKKITLRNIRYGKYAGRVLAEIYAGDQNIGERLVQAAYARAYNGGQRHSWC